MGHEILVLTGDDAARLPVGEVMSAVRAAYIALSAGQVEMSPKHRWHFGVGMNSAFSSHVIPLDVMAIKLGTSRPTNPERGLPRAYSQIVVHDPVTGAPVALLDGTVITAMRTGAAAALGAVALARPDATTAAVVGTGVVAEWSIRALVASRSLDRIAVIGRTQGSAERLVDRMREELPALLSVSTTEEAIPRAGIVITATTSTEPLFADALVAPGTHISSVGSDAPGKRELDVRTILRARYVTDSRVQALAIGEANVAHSEGVFDEGHISAEIGEILAGSAPGRQDATQITVFDSSGVAVQDAATARAVIDLARRDGLGQRVRL